MGAPVLRRPFSVSLPEEKISSPFGLRRLFRDSGIPFINPVDALLKAFGPNPAQTSLARDDPHPKGAAHRIMANQLSNDLLTLDFKTRVEGGTFPFPRFLQRR